MSDDKSLAIKNDSCVLFMLLSHLNTFFIFFILILLPLWFETSAFRPIEPHPALKGVVSLGRQPGRGCKPLPGAERKALKGFAALLLDVFFFEIAIFQYHLIFLINQYIYTFINEKKPIIPMY